MRNETRDLVLGGVFILLAALYVSGLLLHRSPPAPVVVPRFPVSSVDHITAGSTELRKESAGEWQVAIDGKWFPADSRKVAGLLSSLSGLTAARVAAEAPGSWKTFRVDAGGAATLSARAGNRDVVRLFIGESSPSGGIYLRAGSKPLVYEVFGNLDSYVTAGPSYWSDLKILPSSVSVSSLQTIEVTAHDFSVGGTTVNAHYLLESSVVAGKSAWTLHGDPKPTLDQQKVLSLEAEILQMVGDRFVANVDPTSTGLASPTATITVSDEQGASWTIEVGRRYGAQFYAKRKDRPYIYLVNQWSLHRAIPSLNELLASASKS